MRRSLHAELLKLVSVRTTWLFASITVLVVALAVLAQAITAGSDAGLPPLADPETQRMLFVSGTGIAPVIAVVFGTLAITTEGRHHTLASTFLAEPRRWVVLVGKSVATAVAGCVLGALAVATGALGAWLVLLATTTEPVVPVDRVLATLGGATLAGALAALLGLGIGGVLRNQAAAIGVALVLLLAVEPLIASFVPEATPWMPSQIATRIAGASPDADPGLIASAVTYLAYVGVAWLGALATLRAADV